jgi:putative two-component system response regulator
MRIVNAVNMHFLKVVLKKYYLTNNLAYVFVESGENIEEVVLKEKPDIIILEDDPEQGAENSFICKLAAISDTERSKWDIVVVHGSGTHSSVPANPMIHYISLDNLLNELPGIVLNITMRLEARQNTLLKMESQKTILYVDDDILMHAQVHDAFSHTSYRMIYAKDGSEGFEKFCSQQPSLVITDIVMSRMSGEELCRKIKADPIGSQIPVIILTGSRQKGSMEFAFNFGADDYLEKPLQPERLVNKVNEYFITRSMKRNEKILIVDDSKMICGILCHAILKSGMTPLTASDGVEALNVISREAPNVLITDINMPGMNGYELVRTIRSTPGIADMKVIMISSNSAPYDIKKGKELGIIRYFVKPFDIDKVLMEVEHILIEGYRIYMVEYEYMLNSIGALVKALEERDPYTRGHTDRVTDLSVQLATFMHLDTKEIDKIRIAATLHDIGKIGIRDDILLKTDMLSADEYLRIQEHPIKGVEILRPVRSLKDVLSLILMHHERWDGQGYPTAIKGNDIIIGARIIAVADAYDAMTTNRPYRNRITRSEALENIRQNAGTQFCPVCAAAFIEMCRSMPAKSEEGK